MKSHIKSWNISAIITKKLQYSYYRDVQADEVLQWNFKRLSYNYKEIIVQLL